MASDVDIIIDPILGAKAVSKVEKDLVKAGEDAGEKSGKKAGKEFSTNFAKNTKGAFKALFSFKSAAVAAGAAIGAVFASRKFIEAASIQEDAVNDLNSALGRTGKFTQQASLDFQKFASDIQQASVVGDEVVLRNAALIQSLGNLSQDGLKQATQAAVDLAAALRIDLTSAATLVGKAAAGEIGSFSRYGVIIKRGATNAETFSNALTELNNKFGGAAAAQLKTFSGATAQLSNAFGDTLEAIGAIVTKSPSFIAVVNVLSKTFASLTGSISKLTAQGQADPFRGIILSGINLARLINDVIIKSFFDLGSIAKVTYQTLTLGVQTIIGAFAKLGGVVGTIIEKVTGSNSLTSALKEYDEFASTRVLETTNALGESVSNIFEPSEFNVKADEFLTSLEEKVLQAKETIDTNLNPADTAAAVTTTAQEAGESLSDLFSGLGTGFAATQKQIESGAVKVAKSAAFVGQSIKRGIGQGIGAGFGAFGKALVEGENALGAFAKAFLGTLGQMMIQQGTAFILQGLGFSVIPGLQGNGATLIAAGAGLATLGGVLTAIGGGGGAAPAGGGVAVGGGAGGGGPIESGFAAEEVEREDPATAIAVNIQGDVLDSDETGLRIVELLNKELDTSGSVVTGLA